MTLSVYPHDDKLQSIPNFQCHSHKFVSSKKKGLKVKKIIKLVQYFPSGG